MPDFRTDQHKIMKKAISEYGSSHQILKAIEELGELERALIKKMMYQIEFVHRDDVKDNHYNLMEEIADVEIMIYQIKLIYGIFYEVDSLRDKKLQRLKTRLGE